MFDQWWGLCFCPGSGTSSCPVWWVCLVLSYSNIYLWYPVKWFWWVAGSDFVTSLVYSLKKSLTLLLSWIASMSMSATGDNTSSTISVPVALLQWVSTAYICHWLTTATMFFYLISKIYLKTFSPFQSTNIFFCFGAILLNIPTKKLILLLSQDSAKASPPRVWRVFIQSE